MVTLWIYGGGTLGQRLGDLLRASGDRAQCSPGAAPGQSVDDYAAAELARIQNFGGAIDALVYLAEDEMSGQIAETVQRAAGGFLACAREAVRSLATRGAPGNLVCVCDHVGVAGHPRYVAAASAAGALLGMVRALAKELGRQRIAVNALACGPLADTVSAGERKSLAQEELFAAMGLGQALRLEELAATVTFLVRGGHGMTGQVLHLDHGVII